MTALETYKIKNLFRKTPTLFLERSSPVFQLSLASSSIGECECVLPPVLFHGNGGLALKGLGIVQLVHPVLEVLAGVGAARLLSCLCSLDDLVGVDYT